MNTKIVTIDLGERSYDIYIGAGLLFRFNDFVPEDLAGRSVFLVCDNNTRPYAETVANTLKQEEVGTVEIHCLKPGEQTKSFAQYEKLCDGLLKGGLNRDSVVMAVGGGVIGDLAGFAAATIMRGVPFVQVPTTLLAQVDSSVGGKTSINSPHGKNLIGAFYQPDSVVIDIDVLKTLPKRELLAGYAEVLKYGLIGDLPFFEWLEQNGKDVCALDTDAVQYAIQTSTKAKAALVETDERESGRRALLNLGHTFGHALETLMGYDGRLLHGEAVSIGIMMAFEMSVRMGLCDREDLERLEAHMKDIGLPTDLSFLSEFKTSVDDVMAVMQKDKKTVGGKMTFILVNGIGEAFITQDVPEEMVRGILRDALTRATQSAGEGSAEKTKDTFNKGIKGLWRSAFSSLSS